MDDDIKKTSLEIPTSLWRRAKIRAVEEDTDFRTIVMRALEMYLATTPKRKGKR